jgi:hypothetical protein
MRRCEAVTPLQHHRVTHFENIKKKKRGNMDEYSTPFISHMMARKRAPRRYAKADSMLSNQKKETKLRQACHHLKIIIIITTSSSSMSKITYLPLVRNH